MAPSLGVYQCNAVESSFQMVSDECSVHRFSRTVSSQDGREIYSGWYLSFRLVKPLLRVIPLKRQTSMRDYV